MAALGAAGLLAAAACGSPATDSSNNPALTKSTIVIGMVNSTTGPFDGSQTKGNEDVAKVWEAWVNKDQGGVNGHPVKVVFGDSRNDPATSTSVANKLANSDKIIAEVGGADSVTSSIWVPVFNSAKVPIIGGEIVEDQVIAQNIYHFSLVGPVSSGLKLSVDNAKIAGAKSMAGVVCAESPTCLLAVDGLKARAAELGMEWKGLTQVRASDPNYTAQCLNVKQAGADFILLGTAASTAQRVLADCQKQGVEAAYFGLNYGAFDQKFIPLSKSGSNILGTVEGFPTFLDTAPVKAYRDAWAKYGSRDLAMNPIQTASWAALEMFRKAMADASDNPTSDEVYRAMTEVKSEDLGGLLAQKVSFEAGKPSSTINCVFRIRMIDGAYTDGATQCL